MQRARQAAPGAPYRTGTIQADQCLTANQRRLRAMLPRLPGLSIADAGAKQVRVVDGLEDVHCALATMPVLIETRGEARRGSARQGAAAGPGAARRGKAWQGVGRLAGQDTRQPSPSGRHRLNAS
jgi:hypothetical protein